MPNGVQFETFGLALFGFQDDGGAQSPVLLILFCRGWADKKIHRQAHEEHEDLSDRDPIRIS
jgi:hypothetical protein